MKHKKQRRLSIFLAVVMIGCMAVTYIYESRQNDATDPQVAKAEEISETIHEAIGQYHNRKPNALAALKNTTKNTTVKAELVFQGLGDAAAMRSLLGLLSQYDVTPVFFVTSEDVQNHPDSLAVASDAGCMLGVVYSGERELENDAIADEVITALMREGMLIQETIGRWPTQVLCIGTEADGLPALAYACGMDTVVVPAQVVSLSDIASASRAQTIVGQLARGAILGVDLSDPGDSPAEAVFQLCLALRSTDLPLKAETLLSSGSAPAKAVTMVYTSERAAAFTFSCLDNLQELEYTLSALKDSDSKATFFVTPKEVTEKSAEIRKILHSGHDVGISVWAPLYTDAESMLLDILLADEILRETYGYMGDIAIQPAYGYINDMLQTACGAGGYTLISSTLEATRAEDARATDAAGIVNLLFPYDYSVLKRGEIVHFQMNLYQNKNTMIGDMIRLIVRDHNIYTVKPVMEIALSDQCTYQYPLADEDILPEVKDKIHTGQLVGDAVVTMANRYIGTKWACDSHTLPGFSKTEMKRLDQTGLVPNNENMVFLSFDDWGSDKVITNILDVLAKHNAQATFFILTQHVSQNPNLLRAIADAGHTIGCHSNMHLRLANSLGNSRYAELNSQQCTQLEADLVTAYHTLQSVVGDMTHGHRPSLTRLFRPPTLAVSKEGLTTVFDCGFSYSVSGSYSPEDYYATSAEPLAAGLAKHTQSGAVLVLHMLNNSIYTAEALDIYLTEMESTHADAPYRFVGLDSVLTDTTEE